MWELVSRRMAFRLSEDEKSLNEFRKKDNPQLSDKRAEARELGKINENVESEDSGKGAEKKSATVGIQA